MARADRQEVAVKSPASCRSQRGNVKYGNADIILARQYMKVAWDDCNDFLLPVNIRDASGSNFFFWMQWLRDREAM